MVYLVVPEPGGHKQPKRLHIASSQPCFPLPASPCECPPFHLPRNVASTRPSSSLPNLCATQTRPVHSTGSQVGTGRHRVCLYAGLSPFGVVQMCFTALLQHSRTNSRDLHLSKDTFGLHHEFHSMICIGDFCGNNFGEIFAIQYQYRLHFL